MPRVQTAPVSVRRSTGARASQAPRTQQTSQPTTTRAGGGAASGNLSRATQAIAKHAKSSQFNAKFPAEERKELAKLLAPSVGQGMNGADVLATVSDNAAKFPALSESLDDPRIQELASNIAAALAGNAGSTGRAGGWGPASSAGEGRQVTDADAELQSAQLSAANTKKADQAISKAFGGKSFSDILPKAERAALSKALGGMIGRDDITLETVINTAQRVAPTFAEATEGNRGKQLAQRIASNMP